ncbi:hypothetical protein BN2476_360070 [Paraburkholderia piptadeniae]|uniref:Uncharacterized protein n=1 Tax=Paraburkholderia piptadeniae TaxID=1701573 RepID=A0A1N7S989_9BURK|nr:hypothetical protein [Paraburkholderia piptadeniae]SIT43979.1 hypothetical protein BN2476_360070 [Paraburkholderia piptadeniae]
MESLQLEAYFFRTARLRFLHDWRSPFGRLGVFVEARDVVSPHEMTLGRASVSFRDQGVEGFPRVFQFLHGSGKPRQFERRRWFIRVACVVRFEAQ